MPGTLIILILIHWHRQSCQLHRSMSCRYHLIVQCGTQILMYRYPLFPLLLTGWTEKLMKLVPELLHPRKRSLIGHVVLKMHLSIHFTPFSPNSSAHVLLIMHFKINTASSCLSQLPFSGVNVCSDRYSILQSNVHYDALNI